VDDGDLGLNAIDWRDYEERWEGLRRWQNWNWRGWLQWWHGRKV